MYYYQHHIGDFDRATRHLSRIERSIYLDLIFQYYETEQALPLDVATLCRKVVARSEEEKAAVLAVLDEFFHETPGGWFHDRCEEELANYRKTRSQASEAGKASAAARAERRMQAMGKSPTGTERRSNGASTESQRSFNDRSTTVQREANGSSTEGQREANEPSTNHKPVTNNQKPVTTEKKSAPPVGDAVLFPDVELQVVEDFKALRKRKGAPITKTAMDRIASEAVKAGVTLEAALRICCARGWQGFEADWIARESGGRSGGRPSINDFGSRKDGDVDPFSTLKKEWA